MKKLGLFILILPLIIIPLIGNAEENTDPIKIQVPKEITDFLSQPSLVPGSPFYGIKRFFEGFGDIFAIGKSKQGQRDLKIALERLSESNILLERGEIDKAAALMKDYQKRLNQGGELIEKLKDNEDAKDLFNKLSDMTKNHNEYLEKVMEMSPNQWKDEFKKAFSDSEKWNIIAEDLKKGILSRMKEVGENIMKSKYITKEVEQELEDKLKKEMEREGTSQ